MHGRINGHHRQRQETINEPEWKIIGKEKKKRLSTEIAKTVFLIKPSSYGNVDVGDDGIFFFCICFF